ncbi:hypothetical protein EO95_04240 [Methanosarcina sp. 1.H.T.1A.1]|nr:hypothetical protein EO95_04240 [Methanosarcina sp. 1.H.T.1A.1]
MPLVSLKQELFQENRRIYRQKELSRAAQNPGIQEINSPRKEGGIKNEVCTKEMSLCKKVKYEFMLPKHPHPCKSVQPA